MSAASNYLETAIFNHVFRNTSYTSPATIYLALFTSTATAADLEAGTITNEVSGGSYARQAVTFGAPTNGVGSNSGTITFPTASAGWGTIRFVAVMDASSAGNVLWHAQLTSDVTINSGNTFQFNTGSVAPSVA
jgi:hypothetical protein